jgi:hypothetical protein
MSRRETGGWEIVHFKIDDPQCEFRKQVEGGWLHQVIINWHFPAIRDVGYVFVPSLVK